MLWTRAWASVAAPCKKNLLCSIFGMLNVSCCVQLIQINRLPQSHPCVSGLICLSGYSTDAPKVNFAIWHINQKWVLAMLQTTLFFPTVGYLAKLSVVGSLKQRSDWTRKNSALVKRKLGFGCFTFRGPLLQQKGATAAQQECALMRRCFTMASGTKTIM